MRNISQLSVLAASLLAGLPTQAQAPGRFTDPMLTPGETVVRSVHVTELRETVDALRTRCGLGAAVWTDPRIAHGVTPIKAIHVMELRTALAEGHRACGRTPPSWTDPQIVPRVTPVKAVHMMELRAAAVIINLPPQAVGTLPAQALNVGGSVREVDLAPYFTDPNGDSLTYAATSSSTGTVTTGISGSALTLRPVAAGTATATVTARDPGGLSAMQSVTVTVVEVPAPACDMTPPPPDPTPVAAVEVACEDWAEFHVGPNGRVQVPFTGDRWYNSNVWNKAAAGGEPYEQCILRRVVDGEDEYGWRWRWPLGTGDVKGYPEVIHGFKPWNLPTRSALPKRISAVRELRVDYEAYLAPEGAYNLAFSLWVTRDNPPTAEGITHEIMVWMDRSCGFQPYPHSRVAEVEIGGATYTLVIERAQSTFGQTYVAFVSHTDQFAGSVDFAPFLAYLVEHGHLPADHYVTDVELGNEVISGTGELWLKTFEVVVR